MKRTANGIWVRPLLVAFLIGGAFQQENGGYAWYPGGVLRQTWRYWQFTRRRHPQQEGYPHWWAFVDPRPTYGFPGGIRRKQSWWS
jgi:hypothetical protein